MLPKQALAAAAVMALVGCAGGAGTSAHPLLSTPASATATQTGVSSGVAAVASAYTLVAIEGHALPFAPVYGKDATVAPNQVVSGTLNLRPDGTFSVATTYRTPEPQGARTFDGHSNGACAPDGGAYRLFWDGGGETAMTAKGDTVTVTNDGVRFQYLRQR